ACHAARALPARTGWPAGVVSVARGTRPMIAASPLDFPPSRSLAGWWRQLTPLQPHALWMAHLLVHRLEALVRLSAPCRLHAFTPLLLEALGLDPGCTLERMEHRLHWPRALLVRALRSLATEGLVSRDREQWSLAAAGRQAMSHGEYSRDRL